MKNPAYILTAVYTQDYNRVKVEYFEALGGGLIADYSAAGEVSDADLEAMIAAEGGDVAGWTCTLS